MGWFSHWGVRCPGARRGTRLGRRLGSSFSLEEEGEGNRVLGIQTLSVLLGGERGLGGFGDFDFDYD